MFWHSMIQRTHNTFFSKNTFLYRVLGLIFLGVVSRLLPHPPNFTATGAIALFGVCALGSIRLSLLTVFSSMLFVDLLLGFHTSLFFVYASYALIVLLGRWLQGKRSRRLTFFSLVASSLLFFLITNWGVWLVGSLYPQTAQGLVACYLNALPFLANDMLSGLTYGFLLFGWLFATDERHLQSIPAVPNLKRCVQ